MDDSFLLPLFLMEQMKQTTAHTEMLVYEGVTLSGARNLEEEDEVSEDEGTGPGKGNAAAGSKAPYAKRRKVHLYDDIRNIDPDVTLFEKTVHLTREEFDDLHSLVRPLLLTAMDVRGEPENEARVPRRRRLSSEEMLFFFLDTLGGPNEGGLGIGRVAHRYSISPGTVSNYFRHVLFAVYKSLGAIHPRLIRWPDANERQQMEGLIIGFPKCFFFVDGNKNRRWRPGRDAEQQRAYDGYKKFHAFSILVFCDLFGRFIRVEMSDKGAESDRNMYTTCDVFRRPEDFLLPEQHGMADMGFAGMGALVVPYKQNQSTAWVYRTTYNRYIRKQRMVNEWEIGFINNRFRLFLGKWPFERELFPIAYTTAAMISNWPFDRRGYALQPRSRYE